MLAKKYDYEYEDDKLYTLKEEKRIIYNNKKIKRYFLKQKLCGLIMIGIGILCPVIDGDATFSLIAVPLGLFLLITKERAMNFR